MSVLGSMSGRIYNRSSDKHGATLTLSENYNAKIKQVVLLNLLFKLSILRGSYLFQHWVIGRSDVYVSTTSAATTETTRTTASKNYRFIVNSQEQLQLYKINRSDMVCCSVHEALCMYWVIYLSTTTMNRSRRFLVYDSQARSMIKNFTKS